MHVQKNIAFLSLLLITVYLHTGAQSLNGKVIYISSVQEVMIKFPSVIMNFNFASKDAATQFETRITNNKNFSINSTVKDFKSTNLIVSEGGNTHLFILKYKENLDARTESLYDFSNKKKLRQEADRIEESVKANDTSKAVVRLEATATEKHKPVALTYDEVIDKAKNLYLQAKYTEAKDQYKQALTFKPQDPWCVYQIKAIDDKLLDAAYQTHKLTADNAFNKKLYDVAKAEYNLALKEKGGDPYALAQLKKIDQVLKDDTYKSYINSGAAALASQQFDQAESAFNEALKRRPNDAEAKKELAKIYPAKAALLKKQQADKINLEIQKQHDDTISVADHLFKAGLLDEARRKYKKADKIKPGEMYSTKRIAEIDSIQLHQTNVINKMKRDSLNGIEYRNNIDKGNRALEAKDYAKAQSAYQAAQKINPSDKYAADKIAAIEMLLSRQEAERKSEARRKVTQDSINKAYASIIRQGTAAMNNNKYEAAKTLFVQAQQLKLDEKFPNAQLDVIGRRLEEIRNNARYSAFIHLADSLAFTAKAYNTALKWYDSAMALRPNEVYPKKQSIAVNKMIISRDSLLVVQTRNERFNAAIGDYRRADAARTERKYEEAYAGYSDFLNKLDTLNISEYPSQQLYYINQAKDYISRLQAYKPKPKADATNANPADNRKKKKKKGNSTVTST